MNNKTMPIVIISIFFSLWIFGTLTAGITVLKQDVGGSIPAFFMTAFGLVIYIIILKSIIKSTPTKNSDNVNQDDNINNTIHMDQEPTKESFITQTPSSEYNNSISNTSTNSNQGADIFLIIFGLIWTFITSFMFISVVFSIEDLTEQIFIGFVLSLFVGIGIFIIIMGIKMKLKTKNKNINNEYKINQADYDIPKYNNNKDINDLEDEFFVKYCTGCGESLSKKDKVCPSCGKEVK